MRTRDGRRPGASGTWYRPTLALLLLLALSAAIHLAVGLTARADAWQNFAGRNYLSHAESIARGDGYWGVRCCMPLYPLMLGGLLKVFGYAAAPLLALHVLFGLMITWAGYQIGRTLFSETVGLAAGLLLALHPYLVKLTMQIIDTGPSVALSSLGMVWLVRAWLAPSRLRGFALAGLCFGLATLVRPVAGPATILLALTVLVGLAWQGRARLGLRASVVLLAAWVVVMSPYWAHNWLKYGTWISLTSHGGRNILKGHTPYYTRVHPLYDTDDFQYVAIPLVEQDPGGAQANRLALQAALDYVREHPIEAILTDVRKLGWAYGWHKVPRSFANSQPRWDEREHRVVDVEHLRPAMQDRIYTAYWVPVLGLFLWGVWCTRSHLGRLVPVYAFIAANAITVALTFADTRYRLEADPLVAGIAAFGGLVAVAYLGRRLWGRWGVPVGDAGHPVATAWSRR
jgi:hypothetical protein